MSEQWEGVLRERELRKERGNSHMQHPCPYFGREHNTYKVNSIRQKGLLVSLTDTHMCCPHHLWKSPKKGERDRNCGLPWGCLAAVPQLIACAVTSKPAFVKQFLTTAISQGAIEYEPFSKSVYYEGNFINGMFEAFSSHSRETNITPSQQNWTLYPPFS